MVGLTADQTFAQTFEALCPATLAPPVEERQEFSKQSAIDGAMGKAGWHSVGIFISPLATLGKLGTLATLGKLGTLGT